MVAGVAGEIMGLVNAVAEQPKSQDKASDDHRCDYEDEDLGLLCPHNTFSFSLLPWLIPSQNPKTKRETTNTMFTLILLCSHVPPCGLTS